MSEEALEVWSKTVTKGAEKLKKCEEALLNKVPGEFKKALGEYVAYLKMVSEATHISEEDLDRCFLDKYSENADR